MTVIDFYKQLSNLLTDAREKFLSKEETRGKLDTLLEKAKESNLDIKVSPNILDEEFLMKLDDERSFTEPEWESDSSYDYDDETSY
jgi:hypothetical protein